MKRRDPTGWTPFQIAVPKSGTGILGPDEKMFMNNRYVVIVRYVGWYAGTPGQWWHLSIRRQDRAPVRDWRDLQRIKNELVDPEAEAIELFPAESRLQDTANQFHLHVVMGWAFPYGAWARRVSEGGYQGSHQRPFDVKPDDLQPAEQCWREDLADARARLSRKETLSFATLYGFLTSVVDPRIPFEQTQARAKELLDLPFTPRDMAGNQSLPATTQIRVRQTAPRGQGDVTC